MNKEEDICWRTQQLCTRVTLMLLGYIYISTITKIVMRISCWYRRHTLGYGNFPLPSLRYDICAEILSVDENNIHRYLNVDNTVRKPIRVTRCRFQVVASTLSLPLCRFQVVASKLSLPSCRFQVVASMLSLPSCRFYVVASKLSLPSCRFLVVAFTWSRVTSCCFCPCMFYVRARFERRKLIRKVRILENTQPNLWEVSIEMIIPFCISI